MQISVTPEEFTNIIISLLFDKLIHPDEIVPNNDNLNNIIDIMEKRGLKSQFLQYYMNMNANHRLNYKRVRDAFTEEQDNKSYRINIVKSEEKNESLQENINYDKLYIKEIVKKTMKIIKNKKFYRANRIIMTDEDIENIIDKVMNYAEQSKSE